MRFPSRSARGFTLVELLVVIGIIALLISILLPSLNQARRAANNVKCLAAQRELGNGFHMYAAEYRGYMPAARDMQHFEESTLSFPEKWETMVRWTDRLAQYLADRDTSSTADLGTQRDSILWACPEFQPAEIYEGDPTEFSAQNVYTGYGMNYYVDYFETLDLNDLAFVTYRGSTSLQGVYPKITSWDNSSSRLLIADSNTDIIAMSNNDWDDEMRIQGFDFTTASYTVPYVWIDGRRHAGNSVNDKEDTFDTRVINALFVDGHAEPQTIKDAHDNIRTTNDDDPSNDNQPS